MLVTLRQLQYVLAVADTGSFSKAAELCHAEQSTVSQQIKSMEEKLGLAIFDRTTLPVKLNEDAKVVVDQAREIVLRVEELLLPFKPKPNRFG